MQKKISIKFVSALVFFFFPFLLSLPNADCSENTNKTLVTVLEGEVSCLEYPEWLSGEVKKGELASAKFIRHESEDVVWVFLDGKEVRAYIPDIVKKNVCDKFEPNVVVLLMKNIRKEQGTIWDLIAVEKKVKQGQVYVADAVRQMTLSEFVSNVASWEGIQDAKLGLSVGVGKIVTKTEGSDTEGKADAIILSISGDTGTNTVSTIDTVVNDPNTKEDEDTRNEIKEPEFAPPNPEPTPTPTPTPTPPPPETLTITTSSPLTEGTENTPYSQTISASGGVRQCQ